MSERIFRMRLSARYEGSENAIGQLAVQHFENGEWKDLDLEVTTAGFVIFCYSAFTCQHMYLRLNAAERGLILDSAHGSFELVAAEDWQVKSIDVRFEGRLRSGSATEPDLAYVVERMKACPVSINLREGVVKTTAVQLTAQLR